MKIHDVTESWDDLPFRRATGDAPHERDTIPERTPEGDFIFYHGTSLENAKKIVAERELRRDDMNCVGVSTSRWGVGSYASLKAMKTKGQSAIVRVVIAKRWFLDHPDSFTREVGGSGRDQFLIRAARASPTVPVLDAKIVRVQGEDVDEGT